MLFRVVAELWTRLLNYLTGMLRWGHPLRQESGYDAGYGAPGCGWRWGGMFQPNFNPFNMWFRQWYSSMPPFYYPQRVPCQNPNTGSYLNSLLSSSLKSTQVEIESDLKSQRAIARLKEPKDILPIPQQYPFQESTPPRWPTECQVVNIRIQHIDAVPNFQEAYYEMTGREVQPKPVGEQDGQVVFQYNPTSAVNYFSRSAVGGCRVLFSNERRQNGLKFESRFESGNLAKAVKITDTYYELSLRSDLYTNKHVQWFYFMVENMAKGVVYSEWFINPLIAEDDIMYTIQPAGDDRTMFSIVNLTKDDSLYNSGMKPVMYSTKDAFMRKLGWRRCGHNIAYYRNDSNGDDDQNATYTLTFNVEFPHDYDCVYLAHSYPYTYTDLQDYLIRLQNHPVKSMYTKLRLLCKSLAGNNVYYLTVTEPPPLDQNALPKKKKAVVISARVHPGETPASWMMKGVMDFITGDSKQAKELREKFIFKLIPMLNPDGVIVGNSRCSLTGRDLNRQYRTVIRETYPPVWHTKLMVKRLMEELGGVAMYCDFHAHSVKHNVFIYGCENRRQAPGGPDRRLHEQVFPLMLHKNTADKFSFENCKFRIQRSKEGTGRVVMWMMGVSNSYTMEASFAGSTLGTRYYTHFTTLDYEQMGKSFCETLLDFVDDAPSKERLRLKIVGRLQKEGSSADEPANIDLSDYTSDEGETSELSEDCPRVDKDSITAPPPSPATSEDKPIKIKVGY